MEKLGTVLMPSPLFVNKKHKSFVHNLTFNPILQLKCLFGQKISRNLSVLGNSLRMRTEISLLCWIIQKQHFNKSLSDSSLSCASNPILKNPRPAPHGAGRGRTFKDLCRCPRLQKAVGVGVYKSHNPVVVFRVGVA